jgi:hypothetical protein
VRRVLWEGHDLQRAALPEARERAGAGVGAADEDERQREARLLAQLQQAAQDGRAVARARRRVVGHQQVVDVVEDHQPLRLPRRLPRGLLVGGRRGGGVRLAAAAASAAAEGLEVGDEGGLRPGGRRVPLRALALAGGAGLQLAEDRGEHLAELGGAGAADVGGGAVRGGGPGVVIGWWVFEGVG